MPDMFQRRCTDKITRRTTDEDGNDSPTVTHMHGLKTESTQSGNSSVTTKDSIRILVIIRQSIIRSGLVSLLSDQPNFKVVGTASNCSECCQSALQLSPHVLLCDLVSASACPARASISTNCSLEGFHQALPDVPAIVILDDTSESQILEASRIGIRGYLTTNTRIENLFTAIRVVKDGGTFLGRHVQSRVVGMLGQLNDGDKIKDARLNDRERTILRLLAQGKRNQDIADTVFLSNSTVKRYVSKLYAKLGASNRAEAVRIGIRKHLIPSE